MDQTPQKQSVKTLKSRMEGQPSPFDIRTEVPSVNQYTHTGGFLRNRKQSKNAIAFPSAEKTDCNFQRRHQILEARQNKKITLSELLLQKQEQRPKEYRTTSQDRLFAPNNLSAADLYGQSNQHSRKSMPKTAMSSYDPRKTANSAALGTFKKSMANTSQRAMLTSNYGYASMKNLSNTFDNRVQSQVVNEDTQSLWKIAARANQEDFREFFAKEQVIQPVEISDEEHKKIELAKRAEANAPSRVSPRMIKYLCGIVNGTQTPTTTLLNNNQARVATAEAAMNYGM